MIHTDIMRKYNVVSTLFVEFERFLDMIGYEDNNQIWIMLFHSFEENHIFIKLFHGTDNHLTVFEIKLLQKINIAHITVDTRNLVFL